MIDQMFRLDHNVDILLLLKLNLLFYEECVRSEQCRRSNQIGGAIDNIKTGQNMIPI